MVTKWVPRVRIWMKNQCAYIVCRGDSENRTPEADFGLSGPKAHLPKFRYSGLKSLDGHERGPHGEEFDENQKT